MGNNEKYIVLLLLMLVTSCIQSINSFQASEETPAIIPGYQLVWNEEFDKKGKPDSVSWSHEQGFQRNQELQYYQLENANIRGGVLVIEGRRQQIKNENYNANSQDWRKNQEYGQYTSASIHTKGKRAFQFGVMEVRARIDTAMGLWPAIWTLGESGGWPANGEIDIMEYYLVKGKPTILANAAWAHKNKRASWDEATVPFSHFIEKDADWVDKFHVWKMDWTKESIKLYLDDELLNEVDLTQTINPDGTNPFHQAHYILLNLAIGSNGGSPEGTLFPKKYEVDYVRVYQKI